MPTKTVEQIDAVTLIINDHRFVDELFSQYEQGGDAETKLRLVSKMIEELSIHAAIEERILYPLIRKRLDNGESLYQEATEEHTEAKQVLARLEQLEVTDEAFDEAVQELIADVRHHVSEEESDILPQLREAVDEQELLELGKKLRMAKSDAPVSPSQEGISPAGGGGDGGAGGVDAGEASKAELYEKAQELGVEGRSQMSKQELAEEINRRQ